MLEIKLFSLVLPAFRQEHTIVENIRRLEKVLSGFPFDNEIIVVVDGTSDSTLSKVERYKHRGNNNKIKLYGYEVNQGKGFAAKYGILRAKGDVVGFIDAGMDINPSGISILIDYMKLNNADVVIGSKLHPDSKVRYPFARRVLSWGYRTLTHLLFGFKIRDTQVGLKIFKRSVAHDIFKRILVKKFAFDIEILAVAYARGYKNIIEAPIRLNFSKASSITSTSFWQIVLRMLWDTLAVFYRLKVLRYYDKIHPIK